MKLIKFRYRDALSHNKWCEQKCIMQSVEECIKWYGLGKDCDYEIISVEDIK